MDIGLSIAMVVVGCLVGSLLKRAVHRPEAKGNGVEPVQDMPPPREQVVVQFTMPPDKHNRLVSENTSIPFAVRQRMFLNKQGFRFEDDGKLSAIWNENPTPIGNMEVWEDLETMSTNYKQTFFKDQL